ncbi:hypothetical protein LguiA_020580 [Lonicera macranthoides]
MDPQPLTSKTQEPWNHAKLMEEGKEPVALKGPVVFRLIGTNVDQGKKILDDSGMVTLVTKDLDDAAKTAVKAATS